METANRQDEEDKLHKLGDKMSGHNHTYTMRLGPW